MVGLSRRRVLAATGGTLAAATLGGTFWSGVLAGVGPLAIGSRYGDLLPADANGVMLPAGFASRVVARTGDPVAGTSFRWHRAPDGGACVASPDGGWRYISNSEVWDGGGSVSVIDFSPAGSIRGAWSILSGTSGNCAGGLTPQGTWLSCEENGGSGRVWECDPSTPGQGVVRPLLGSFNHEAAVVDPSTGIVYLTEDRPRGRLYRFVPTTPGDLRSGRLEAATMSGDPLNGVATLTWQTTGHTAPDRDPATTPFDGGEGAWIHEGRLLFTTKGDRRVWNVALAPTPQPIEVLHDCSLAPDAPLDAVDNVVVHHRTGDVMVAEDGGNMELCGIERRPDGSRRVGAFLRITGQSGSEVTGPAFSPDGSRLYFSSQRGTDGRGITYEVVGPFDELTFQGVPTANLRPAKRLEPSD